MISMQSINRISFKSILSANSELYFLQELETSAQPSKLFLNFQQIVRKKPSKYLRFTLIANQKAILHPQNIKIQGCRCSLTSWGEGATLALVGHPSSVGVNKNTLWGRCCTTSTRLAPHLFLLGWLKLDLILLSDQLRLA